MENYARLYNFYSSLLIRILRLIVLIFLIYLLYENITTSFFPSYSSRLSIFFLSLFLMLEIFFRFKISRITPKVLISENDGSDIFRSFTLTSLGSFLKSDKISKVIEALFANESILFILEKSGIKKGEVPLLFLPKEKVTSFAFEIAKNVKGEFVTVMDILVAYLLLIEDDEKLLFNKNLKKEELLHILSWARNRFPDEERPKPYRINFEGEGIGEDWAIGWTIESKKYMLDLTYEIYMKKPVLYDREIEYKEIIEALYNRKSVILVGEAGSGRGELVRTIAFDSISGTLSGSMYHQRFFQFMVDALLAGSKDQGELEERLNNLIAELAHSGNIIIFVPYFENILGASSFHLDLSGALVPYLERGLIRIVATVSPGAYKKFIEQRKDLLEVFDAVKISEPNQDLALNMLFSNTQRIEEKNKINLTYKAIMASLKYSKKYMPDFVLPGSAVTLLDDSSISVKLSGKNSVNEQDILNEVENKTKIAVGKPSSKEKELLLNLEKEMHKSIIGQNEAVSVISEAMRRIRTEIEVKEKPISFLFLGPTGVGKTETAKTLARIYFGGEGKMIRADMSEYSGSDGNKRLLGFSLGEDDKEGSLADDVHSNPFSLVLLDEFEKADKKILDLFLQVLDDGRLTDNKGRTVSFVDTIIIATSNAASEFIREEIEKGGKIDKNFQNKLLEFLQTKGIFKPELLNRFDAIVVFKPLEKEEITQITKLMLEELKKKMKEKDIEITFDSKIIEKIINEGFDEQFGARPLRRYLQDNIEDLIAQKILKEEIKRGDKITVSVDQGNNISMRSQDS
ncbi:MAG: ATP-dependent Clp protease ATP-binding subunit [Candidatus Levybacteria bacterium]|nr:ATP-dependent Clp protease ATP-binding subunit [Candidatus Levybacteria bacterium]